MCITKCSQTFSDTITKTLSCPKNVYNKKTSFSMHRSVDMVSRRPSSSLTQSGYSFCIAVSTHCQNCTFISNTTTQSRPLLASIRNFSAKTALFSWTLRHVERLLLASFCQHSARFVLCLGMIGELRWTCRHGTLCDHLLQVVEDV